jgi:hypothetical protein
LLLNKTLEVLDAAYDFRYKLSSVICIVKTIDIERVVLCYKHQTDEAFFKQVHSESGAPFAGAVTVSTSMLMPQYEIGKSNTVIRNAR